MTGQTDDTNVAMFMSVDLAGSTAYKQEAQGTGDSPGWVEAFEAFFREVPLTMMGQIAAAFIDEEEAPDCTVWKVIGDEIVFLSHPASARQAQLLTLAFYNTIVNYDIDLFERWPLRLRGCCWAAQISDRNREIKIPEMVASDSAQTYVDYLGPDVDAGFRLLSSVGRGQMMLSSNLVQALAGLEEDSGIRFHYVGRKVLKGVYRGRPDPLFLMSCAVSMPQLWEWEPNDDEGLRELRKDEPMPYNEILDLIGKIQNYLNHMCHANIKPLRFPEDD